LLTIKATAAKVNYFREAVRTPDVVRKIESDYRIRWECGARLKKTACHAGNRCYCFLLHGVVGHYDGDLQFVEEKE